MIDKKRLFIPGKITEYLFSIFLIISLIGGLITTPFTAILNNNLEGAVFKIGYPLYFFELNSTSQDSIPFRPVSMLLDLAMYLIVAYIIEIIFKLIVLSFSKKVETPKIDLTKIDPERLEKIKQAKKAYDYYILQKVSKDNLIALFKEKGWTDQDINIMQQLT